jgi:hypothetical protein
VIAVGSRGEFREFAMVSRCSGFANRRFSAALFVAL